MARKSAPIQVELHMPESLEDIKAIQDVFNQTLCRCIAKKLENLNLTYEEKKYVIEKISEKIGEK